MNFLQTQWHGLLDECQQSLCRARLDAGDLLHTETIKVHDDDDAIDL